jgi:hypothetical protein
MDYAHIKVRGKTAPSRCPRNSRASFESALPAIKVTQTGNIVVFAHHMSCHKSMFLDIIGRPAKIGEASPEAGLNG